MKQKHRKTLELIFKRPVSGNLKWNEIESLFWLSELKSVSGKAPELR